MRRLDVLLVITLAACAADDDAGSASSSSGEDPNGSAGGGAGQSDTAAGGAVTGGNSGSQAMHTGGSTGTGGFSGSGGSSTGGSSGASAGHGGAGGSSGGNATGGSAGGAGGPTGDFVPRANYGAKLEPNGYVVHGAGQSQASSVDGYCSALESGKRPKIFMDYTNVNGDPKGDVANLKTKLTTLETKYTDLKLMAQIGLSMTVDGNPAQHYEQDVATGKYDANIDAFGDALNQLGRGIYLRIGYEFNGSWNGYQPSTYQQAFQRVTTRLRAKSVNFATVWCAYPATTSLDYYPGDAYVDWFGLDIFDAGEIGSADVASFLTLADQHHKPVIIGESTPRHVGVLGGQQSWDTWFKPYFMLIRQRKEIKAFDYIDWNWASHPQWADWGDARIEANTVVTSDYRDEMTLGLYLHSGSAFP